MPSEVRVATQSTPATTISPQVIEAEPPPTSEKVAIVIPFDPTIKTDTPITDQNLPLPQWAAQVRACMTMPEKIVRNVNGRSVCSPN